ncbi:RNA-binding domain-containing protein [Hypoxylon sp. NC1633]|nr:RNA-binding domain-containing protein [Hypoxylon sp. NC1633]
MSGADNWRDSSNWRTKDSAPPSTAGQSRSSQNLFAASSWRARGAPPTDGESQREPRQSWAPKSRPYDRERSNKEPQEDEGAAAKAIAEGRRIYVGNLRYQAKPDDIEGLLNDNGLGNLVKIHISIDPFTGRNPSYCFIEFGDRDSAEKAMSTLEGKPLLGREVKCRPCNPKGGSSGGRQGGGPNRWGDWSGEKSGGDREHASDAPASFDRYKKDFNGRRLYVGGLPRMHDQATNFAEVSEIFEGFQLEAVSKRVTAHESTRSKQGQHDFCFVDFATQKQAEEALNAVNGKSFRGGPLKVSFASGRSNKWQERETTDRDGAEKTE